MGLKKSLEKLTEAFHGGYPILYLLSWEEDRVEKALKAFSGKLFENGTFEVWTSASGFQGNTFESIAIRDPMEALDEVMRSDKKGIYLFKDLTDYLVNDPVLVRKLRDTYYALKNKKKFIIVLTPKYYLPDQLKKEVYLIEFDLPDENEIYDYMKPVMKMILPDEHFTDDYLKELSMAMKGLTMNEVGHTINKIFSRQVTLQEGMQSIFQEKEQIVRKEGILEYIPPRFTLEEIGGLDNLKEWLIKRANLFTRQALEENMPVPRGILLMGVSGCGKSLGVKVISSLWKVPLFRLDMNLVFSGVYGSPESIFHSALKQLEAMSPAVLWIDEIEMGVAGYREGESVTSAHIFAHFLTWMQEKDKMVFVGATANRIQLLPAEIIRKGRFDQIFFIDLPNDEERKQIFSIHIKKNGVDPNNFDLVFLSAATKGWNGSEIEQAVIAARIDAYYEHRQFVFDDVIRNTAKLVPLSQTMETQIKQIKSWAFNRAMPASGKSIK
ncbi:MAG: hypothetical protein A2Y62_10755 [Candidatus Fischerbacteria bacterium RBG_13_37_8]|uniref:Uncharacterized AAA domain-containing protein ycf46 n=1 Tax=Candidatus Fischerbacteria bacterium RBG_13_37_8 TaxID=1817863 RepID=A0A1F5VUE9_9BACT|nr:MAG: hypothetical protein A2Y62_10755 [Candidatus Fischerbacteria bacterium RBG_13_37_8]